MPRRREPWQHLQGRLTFLTVAQSHPCTMWKRTWPLVWTLPAGFCMGSFGLCYSRNEDRGYRLRQRDHNSCASPWPVIQLYWPGFHVIFVFVPVQEQLVWTFPGGGYVPTFPSSLPTAIASMLPKALFYLSIHLLKSHQWSRGRGLLSSGVENSHCVSESLGSTPSTENPE